MGKSMAVGNYDDAALGAKVRKAREDRGLTAAALAAAVGLNPPAMSKLETGKLPWTVERLYEVAQALSASPASLLPDGPDVRLGMVLSDVERELVMAARRRDQLETIRLALVALVVREP